MRKVKGLMSVPDDEWMEQRMKKNLKAIGLKANENFMEFVEKMQKKHPHMSLSDVVEEFKKVAVKEDEA